MAPTVADDEQTKLSLSESVKADTKCGQKLALADATLDASYEGGCIVSFDVVAKALVMMIRIISSSTDPSRGSASVLTIFLRCTEPLQCAMLWLVVCVWLLW